MTACNRVMVYHLVDLIQSNGKCVSDVSLVHELSLSQLEPLDIVVVLW